MPKKQKTLAEMAQDLQKALNLYDQAVDGLVTFYVYQINQSGKGKL